jgi:hypothetical protein
MIQKNSLDFKRHFPINIYRTKLQHLLNNDEEQFGVIAIFGILLNTDYSVPKRMQF